MTPPEIIEILSRHQVLLEGLKTGYVQDFLKVFGTIDGIIRDSLRALNVDILSEVSRPRLERVLADMGRAQAQAFDKTIDAFIDKMPKLAKYETEFQARALKSVLPAKAEKLVKLPKATKAFEEAIKRPLQATGDNVKPFIQDWSRTAIKRTNNAVRIAYQQGKPTTQAVRQLVGTEQLRFKDGVTAVNKRQAATVIHTSTQHVAMTARAVTYEENDDLVVGYIIIATIDGKTSTICRSLDRKKFKHGKGPMPPLHPNCRSSTAPDLDSEFDFLDEGATRSGVDGPIDAETTYYEWLKRQSPAFQKEVLGAKRAQLFQSGGLSEKRFAELQLDKNFQPLTLDEMRALEPLAFERAGV